VVLPTPPAPTHTITRFFVTRSRTGTEPPILAVPLHDRAEMASTDTRDARRRQTAEAAPAVTGNSDDMVARRTLGAANLARYTSPLRLPRATSLRCCQSANDSWTCW
jgi:hypothetical protein